MHLMTDNYGRDGPCGEMSISGLAMLLKGSGPIKASSANIERCAKQIDSKDIFILSGRLKPLSSRTTAVNQAQE
jgi:hypothetical protein